jgi:predicted GNAT superfamily acetyltransferase
VSVELRVLRTADELAVMPEFEAKIWGGQDDRVSVNMLVACIEEGGVAIGAFDGDRMVGSLFGFRTFEARVLHSHYMAVDAEYRRGGLGERLKRRQAEWCVDNGVTAMRWTFDPLQLTNAHLNLNKLGAFGVTYHANHYGALGGINGSLPSDRLTVQWELERPRPAFAETFVLDVPAVSPEQIAASAPEALHARLAVRDAMAPHLADGWKVIGVDRERTYTLGRSPPTPTDSTPTGTAGWSATGKPVSVARSGKTLATLALSHGRRCRDLAQVGLVPASCWVERHRHWS